MQINQQRRAQVLSFKRTWFDSTARRIPLPPLSGRQEDRETRVAIGDRVRDPLDNGRWRTVTRIEGTTVYLADGGCMGIDECREIRLPSEALD